MVNRLIVSAEDIRNAVLEAEEQEKRALKLAQQRDIADGKPPRKELRPDRITKPGRQIVLDYIKNPERRMTPRCKIQVMNRDTKGRSKGNGYDFIVSVAMVRNRELADNIEQDLEAFMDYLLDEYDIPKRRR